MWWLSFVPRQSSIARPARHLARPVLLKDQQGGENESDSVLPTSVSAIPIIIGKSCEDLHLDEVKSHGNIPLRPRLVTPQVTRVLARRTHIQPVVVFGNVHRVTARAIRTPALRSQHQNRRRDPEQKDQRFGRHSYYGPGGRAAGEGVALHMSGDEVVEGEGEGGDGGDDADSEGAVDRGPPAAVDAGVAD